MYVFSVAAVSETASFRNTVLPGDLSGSCVPDFDLRAAPITETIRSREVFLLPTAFEFDGVARRVTRREHFTFIGSPVKLKDALPAYHVGDESVVFL